MTRWDDPFHDERVRAEAEAFESQSAKAYYRWAEPGEKNDAIAHWQQGWTAGVNAAQGTGSGT